MPLAPDGTAYRLAGPESEPFVVLIHGLGLSAETTWAGIAPALAGRFRVLSYDLPGHGTSRPLDAAPDLDALSDQLVRLLDHVGAGPAAVVGFSLGGMINRKCALRHPDRVRALAILNSPHERPPEQQARVEAEARAAAASGPGATIDAALARWFTPDFARASPGVVARVRHTVLGTEPVSYAGHRLTLAAGVTELVRPDPAIGCPALVMTCEHDTGSTPAMAATIAGEIDGSDLIVVPGLKHLGLVERPADFLTPVTRFLDRLG